MLENIYFIQKEESNWGEWNKKDVSHIEKNSKTTGINPTSSVIMLREKGQL